MSNLKKSTLFIWPLDWCNETNIKVSSGSFNYGSKSSGSNVNTIATILALATILTLATIIALTIVLIRVFVI